MKMYSLGDLAKQTNSKLVGNADHLISNVNTLEQATSQEASFLTNPRYREAMKLSNAGVICIDDNSPLIEGKNYLISDDASFTFQKLLQIFKSGKQISGFSEIHPTAIIHPSAKIGQNVTILPKAVIDKDVNIDEGTFIGANVYIGPNVQIGRSCTIHANVVIREDTVIHNNVIIQPGAVIGSCGFGYTQDKEGKFQKLDQIGNVEIDDDAEIGANTTIDRARFKTTRIGKNSKIDNLIQIAHNVEIGDSSAIAAQTGIAGSTKIGSHVIMGGQCGITGHIEISDNVMLATRTGVSKNISSGKYRGTPAMPLSEYNRQYVFMKKLQKLLSNMEEKIKILEEKLS